MTAWNSVIVLDPTEVANAFATSFAPMPKARKNAVRAPAHTAQSLHTNRRTRRKSHGIITAELLLSVEQCILAHIGVALYGRSHSSGPFELDSFHGCTIGMPVT